MTKKILRISSMTLGLALLLLGNGMNHAKADFQIHWPKGSNKNKVFEVFFLAPNQPKTRIAFGPTSGVSYYKVSVIGAGPWSSYPQGVINILVGAQSYNLSMTSWKNTGNNSINDVLNKTSLTLNSSGTSFTITYPN